MPTSESSEHNQCGGRFVLFDLKKAHPILPAVVLLLGISGCTGSNSHPDSTVYLESAIEAARFLIAQSDHGSGGGIPVRIPDGDVEAGLGMGAAGHALFFAELYAATEDSVYADAAAAASRTAIEGSEAQPTTFGLYSGLAGIASAVTLVSEVIDDPELNDEGHRLFLELALAGDPQASSVGWSDVYDVMNGRAGIGLALLQGYRLFEDPRLLDAAVRAGDDLLEVAVPAPDSTLRWVRSFQQQVDLPNFSHGTAGVGFLMTRLAEYTGLPRFLDAALAAEEYLDEIADTTDGLYLVPYGVPNEGYETAYDIGWAHGPPGTARLHFLLWELLEDPSMRERAESAARTLSATGLPNASTDQTIWSGPFNIDQRFGTSGAAEFLMDWGIETGNRRWTRLAGHIVLDILEKSTRSDQGLFWRIPEYSFQGDGEAVFTGYFYGSAGMGLALLRQHYQSIGEEPRVRLPDETLPLLWASRKRNRAF